MTWLLSPAGWPSNVTGGSLIEARLLGEGWVPLSESQVPAPGGVRASLSVPHRTLRG